MTNHPYFAGNWMFHSQDALVMFYLLIFQNIIIFVYRRIPYFSILKYFCPFFRCLLFHFPANNRIKFQALIHLIPSCKSIQTARSKYFAQLFYINER